LPDKGEVLEREERRTGRKCHKIWGREEISLKQVKTETLNDIFGREVVGGYK